MPRLQGNTQTKSWISFTQTESCNQIFPITNFMHENAPITDKVCQKPQNF